MPERHFNWKLTIILLIGLVVIGLTAFGIRRWQKSRRAEQGLILGNQAYDEYKWEDAANNLGLYVAVIRDDIPVLLKYADAQLCRDDEDYLDREQGIPHLKGVPCQIIKVEPPQQATGDTIATQEVPA